MESQLPELIDILQLKQETENQFQGTESSYRQVTVFKKADIFELE